MGKSTVVGFAGREATGDPLTELLREGARELIQQAVEAELSQFMAALQDRRLEDGRAAVVRNGYQPERAIPTGVGPVTVKVPRFGPKMATPFSSTRRWCPPYLRKTRSLEVALPWLYLKGVSSGEMESALSRIPRCP